mgnify:FL=1
MTGEAQDAKLVDNASVKYGSYFGQKEVEEGKKRLRDLRCRCEKDFRNG